MSKNPCTIDNDPWYSTIKSIHHRINEMRRKQRMMQVELSDIVGQWRTNEEQELFKQQGISFEDVELPKVTSEQDSPTASDIVGHSPSVIDEVASPDVNTTTENPDSGGVANDTTEDPEPAPPEPNTEKPETSQEPGGYLQKYISELERARDDYEKKFSEQLNANQKLHQDHVQEITKLTKRHEQTLKQINTLVMLSGNAELTSSIESIPRLAEIIHPSADDDFDKPRQESEQIDR